MDENDNKNVPRPYLIFQIYPKKIHRIHTKLVELIHHHAGVTGPASVGDTFPYLQMQMIWRAEIGLDEFILAEKTGQRRVRIHPIICIHFDIFDMGVDREQMIPVRQVVFDDHGLVREFTENPLDQAVADWINLLVERSFEVDARVQMSRLVAPPELAIKPDQMAFDKGEIPSARAVEWREKLPLALPCPAEGLNIKKPKRKKRKRARGFCL